MVLHPNALARQRMIEEKHDGAPEYARVSADYRCPVCRSSHWCYLMRFPSGSTLVGCMRVESPRPAGNDNGWYHDADGDYGAVAFVRGGPEPQSDRSAEWEECVRRLEGLEPDERPDRLTESRLGLPDGAYARAVEVGAYVHEWGASALAVAERDGDGVVIGWSTRLVADDEKRAAHSRGVTVPRDFGERAARTGTVYVVEGASDVVALHTAELCALGLPGAGVAREAAGMLARLPETVVVTVVQEPDEAGYRTAVPAAAALGRALGRPVPICPMPGLAGVCPLTGEPQTTFPKDPRAWLSDRAHPGRGWAERGRLFAEAARRSVATWEDALRSAGGPAGTAVTVAPATEVEDPPVTNPHWLARTFGATYPHLRRWRAQWWRYADGAYKVWGDADVEAAVIKHMRQRFAASVPGAVAKWQAGGARGARPGEPPVSRRLTADVLAVLMAETKVEDDLDQPAWLDGRACSPPIVVRNGLLDLRAAADRRPDCRTPHDPEYFASVSLPYDYDPQAPTPTKWLTFIGQVFPGDPDAIATLQEWAGYLLSGSTRMQKIMLMVGLPGSGKGTILRVLTALMGADNVGSLTGELLAGRWALGAIANKSVALLSDARFDGRSAVLVERLLSISGEDTLPIEKKGKDVYEARIPARLLIATNVTPRLTDSSTAIVRRLLTLSFRKSFDGSEDPTLTDKLTEELGGILLWALEGWRRLEARGRFVQPASGDVIRQEARALASPVSEFVAEMCEVGDQPHHRAPKANVYREYKEWCEAHGHQQVMTSAQFGAALRSAVVGLGEARPRDDGGARENVYTGLRLRSMPLSRSAGRGPGGLDPQAAPAAE